MVAREQVKQIAPIGLEKAQSVVNTNAKPFFDFIPKPSDLISERKKELAPSSPTVKSIQSQIDKNQVVTRPITPQASPQKSLDFVQSFFRDFKGFNFLRR